MEVQVSDTVQIQKLNEDENIVFGWASMAIDKNGRPVVDGEGDVISVEQLEKASYEFVKNYREANERHQGPSVGQLVMSVVTTADVKKMLGIQGPEVGWLVAFELEPETFAKVKDGTYRSFSIEGSARRVAA